jgi:GxxExxY protein
VLLGYKHTNITELIIKAFYKVYNTLGYGFLEKVYKNALEIELQKLELEVSPEARILVYYEGKVVGEYFADLLVASVVLVELKTVEKLMEEQSAVDQLSESHALRGRPAAQLWPQTRDQAQGLRQRP